MKKGTRTSLGITVIIKFNFPARYQDDLSLEDAIHTAILVLKEGFEGNMTSESLEIGVLSRGSPAAAAKEPTGQSEGQHAGQLSENNPTFHILTETEIADYLANL